MIVKNLNLKKFLTNTSSNIFLLYGENIGLIEDTIKSTFLPIFPKTIKKYDENDILRDKENFRNLLVNRSFFEDEKLIIINRGDDSIVNILEETSENITSDIKIIIKSGLLEKKSKLRKFFEKSDNLVIVPFYEDSFQSLYQLVQNFFRETKINISAEGINLIIERSKSNRINLNNELNKISLFCKNRKIIQARDILKITNLAENHSISELVDQCLAKNKKKTIDILNENNLSNEDNILILRTFLIKLKRLKKIKIDLNDNKNIDLIFSTFKPPIFWKDKDIIKRQVRNLSLNEINILIKKINYLELQIKKNIQISNQIINNFIINNVSEINNII